MLFFLRIFAYFLDLFNDFFLLYYIWFNFVLFYFLCFVPFLHWTALLTEEMEDIAAASSSTNNPLTRGWTVDCTIKMGVTYGEVLESFMSFSDRWGSKVSEKHTHLLYSISYALMEWKRDVIMWEIFFNFHWLFYFLLFILCILFYLFIFILWDLDLTFYLFVILFWFLFTHCSLVFHIFLLNHAYVPFRF